MKIIKIKSIFYTVTVLLLVHCTSEKVSVNLLEGTIDTVLVKKHLYTLASDDMQGRKAGTPGIEKAAKYIEGEFEALGLKTFQGANSYRQNFTKENLALFNVIGVLEGNSKKEEFVVISAHYDHLGILPAVNGDEIANGADDDASGVTAVLSLASYWSKRGDNERTLVFIAFTAEEKGLWGSNYFGTKISPEKYIAGINIEMIGKDSKFGPRTAFLTGFERSSFGKIIQENLKGSNFTLHPDPYQKFNLFYRSDNASLAKLGIPAHTFSTCPIDTDAYYHTVDDEVETLDLQNIATTIKAIAIGTASIINGKDTPSRVSVEK
ncbi:M20/M25/M40 family metallo-hydrolase [Flavicella sediminum]|uniref:M20/M25/M40 family metallo-hydrolase n=1 Tax=Flavicella sediminum TaxID=2585141 RepID=UPI00112313FD|nr:M20/M25/M40 family metallo-hydrolase [Flavicella sediminum]